jgi:hypothetical protein
MTDLQCSPPLIHGPLSRQHHTRVWMLLAPLTLAFESHTAAIT